MTVEQYVRLAKEHDASDIHLIHGLYPAFRVDRLIRPIPETGQLTEQDCLAAAKELSGDAIDTIEPGAVIDMSKTICSTRCRITIFRQQNKWSIAIRLLNDHIPGIKELGLPDVVEEFATYGEGLVLVTGVTGSGKSTTLAAIIGLINATLPEHIVTLEDPIEYIHIPNKCIINQREVYKDTKSYATGLSEALREDPDVILLGEMRDTETIGTALTAAETGHLVFGTIHASSTADAVDRIVGVFPGERQPQVRMQLAQTLRAVLNQNLFPKVGGGRILACEVMKSTSAIRAYIREGKTQQIGNAITQSRNVGNILMDDALKNLLQKRYITKQIYDSFKSQD